MTCDCFRPSSLMRSIGSVDAFEVSALAAAGADGWAVGAVAGGCCARRASTGTRPAHAEHDGGSKGTSHDGGSPSGLESRMGIKRVTRDTASVGTPRRERGLGLRVAFYEVGARVSPSQADIFTRNGRLFAARTWPGRARPGPARDSGSIAHGERRRGRRPPTRPFPEESDKSARAAGPGSPPRRRHVRKNRVGT